MARGIACPVGLSLEILQQECKSDPLSLSQTKDLQQMSSIRACFPGIDPLGGHWKMRNKHSEVSKSFSDDSICLGFRVSKQSGGKIQG